MNTDINIVIKSQGQPDGGEGHRAGQAVRGNAHGEEGLSANVQGDAQEPSEAIPNRDESATQDEVLYSSHEEGRRLGARARKVNEHTPGEPLSVTQVTYRVARRGHRLSEVSREHSSRRRNETGVVADGAGYPSNEGSEKHHPDEGSNGAEAEWQR
ncbi:MAG: hypothetical protein AAF546_12625 [Verrucomicrobiota bacterium]